MKKKYVVYTEYFLSIPTIYIGELIKETPKTLKIKPAPVLFSCYREIINKENDEFKIVEESQAKQIWLFSKEMEKQYNAVKFANQKQYKENILNFFN